MEDNVTLASLGRGEKGYILALKGDMPWRRRMEELGATPGAEVELVRSAPMGDPVEIRLRGYSLALRREDAARVWLTRAAPRRAAARPRDEGGQWGWSEGPLGACLALVGNPNCGKTTLFNALTGSREHVGNWPGVTVERAQGRVREEICPGGLTLVDLPGIYSLSPYSPEEEAARDYLVKERPRAIINILDASNLERNLYLTVQLMELGLPMVLALNMMDEAERRGDRLDVEELSRRLGVSAMPICARTGQGVKELAAEAAKLAGGGYSVPKAICAARDDPEAGYGCVAELLEGCYARGRRAQGIIHWLDGLLTHRLLALPVFLGVMLGIFGLTFSGPGEWLSGLAAGAAEGAAACVRGAMEGAGAGAWLTGLLCDGVLAGVGGALAFLPQIAVLSLLLSALEDSGYMSRIAFVMDRPMAALGLSGKGVIPLLMGFGCTVPAALSCRALEGREDRRRALLMLPFMSCSAKLPVYGLVAGALFGSGAAAAILGLYGLGIGLGAASTAAAKGAGARRPLILELPPYRLPAAGVVLRQAGERAGHFLRRAGGTIVLVSMGLWLLQGLDLSLGPAASPRESILGRIGGTIAPAFAPLGFGDWRAAVALLSGLGAKEAVASTLALLTGGDAAALFTRRSGLAFLTFALLYPPCMAAMAALKRELGGAGAAAMAAYQLAVAYGAAWLVYGLYGLLP